GIDAAGPVEQQQDGREQEADELVDQVRLAVSDPLVEAREVLRRAGILVDLRLHWESPTREPSKRYPLGRAQPRERSSARSQPVVSAPRSSPDTRASSRPASRHLARSSAAGHRPTA